MRLREARRDLYRRRARAAGYVSRAAFKLLEIDRKYHLLRPGSIVVDVGAAPGGWTQVAARHVGRHGRVVAVDVRPLRVVLPNVAYVAADVMDGALAGQLWEVLRRMADVVLSDIAPQVTGIWELDHRRQVELTRRVLTMLPRLLRPGGASVLKLFDGEEFPPVHREARRLFAESALVKPPASRGASAELYFVGRGYRVRTAT